MSHTLLGHKREVRTDELRLAKAFQSRFPDDADRSAEWADGKQIRQSDIRNSLGTAAVPEPKDHLDEMYRVYSLFTHVNRKTVYQRMLGEKNRVTLGCQGNVSEEIVASVLRELLRQTMWFVDVANFTFLKVGLRPPEAYAERMLRYRDEVQYLAKKLPALFPERKSPGAKIDTVSHSATRGSGKNKS